MKEHNQQIRFEMDLNKPVDEVSYEFFQAMIEPQIQTLLGIYYDNGKHEECGNAAVLFASLAVGFASTILTDQRQLVPVLKSMIERLDVEPEVYAASLAEQAQQPKH